jgi:hypothetical protein
LNDERLAVCRVTWGKGLTLEAGLDHVEGVDGECRYGASGEASDGLDQRGGEAHMVVIHMSGLTLIMFLYYRGRDLR